MPTSPTPADRPAWVDGDPLMEATASAVWEQCRTENSIVVDDPRNIAAVAATVARQLLGTTEGVVCVHPEHYEGECPCPSSCVCCRTAPPAPDTDLSERIQSAIETYPVALWTPENLAGRIVRVVETETAPPVPLAEVWTVWRENEPVYGHYTTEEAARQGTIDCWQEDEPVCPDYSWRQDGPRLELVVGGEFGGVYASRHRVYGAPPAPADRAAVLREAANGLAALGPLDNLVSAPAAWNEAIETLRRMADQMAADAAAGVQPPTSEAEPEPEPLTEEQIIRQHVTTVHLIGDQLADVESWLWQRLADARDTTPPAAPAAPEEQR